MAITDDQSRKIQLAEALQKASAAEFRYVQEQFEDEQARLDFLSKADDERKAEIEKAGYGEAAQKGDEPTDDRFDPDIAKRDDLDEDVKKAWQADRDRLAALEKKDRDETLAKQAEQDYPNLSGDRVQKGRLLGVIQGIADDELRKFAEETLKAADSAIGMAMTEKGQAGQPAKGSAEEQLDQMAARKAEEDGISKAQAYDKVLQTDEGRKLYNAQYGASQ